jgi:DNA-directed RNA polymerase specialized sigma24 family protein
VERRAPGRASTRRWRSQRTAVVLRYEQGLSFDEIGQVLGIAEATARSQSTAPARS